jgi:ABC-type Fe3+/spermidine/putrescine transport system ATPase subunit
MDALLGCEHPQSISRAVSATRAVERGAAAPDDAAPRANAGTLSLRGLTRRFGSHAAVDDLSLDIAPGELLALVGASGSGKTTTLRMVAGYEVPDGGRISLDGRDITALPPQRRDFGMVFQHYALFPHMSVGENVAFGLEARGVNRSERRARAARALANVGLEGAVSRPVQSLSGGEQQRVALARALVIEPRVLLLDEPLSNLDPTLRRSTREELRATLHRLGVTALFVTHDQEDAFAIADRVALIRQGRLLQVGPADELYDRPASRGVAEFIGHGALVPAVLSGDEVTLSLGEREWRLAAARPAGVSDGPVLAVLRPDALAFTSPEAPAGWPAIITERRFAGALIAYHARLADDTVLELYGTERDVRIGDAVGIRVAREPVAVVAP